MLGARAVHAFVAMHRASRTMTPASTFAALAPSRGVGLHATQPNSFFIISCCLASGTLSDFSLLRITTRPMPSFFMAA